MADDRVTGDLSFSAPGNSVSGTNAQSSVEKVRGFGGGAVRGTPGLVDVQPPPEAAFVALVLSGTVPLSVSFINSSKFATGYSWNFGDNSALSTQTNPTHTYTSPGSYTVTLTATSAGGSNVLTRVGYINATGTVVVPPPPAAPGAYRTTQPQLFLSVPTTISYVASGGEWAVPARASVAAPKASYPLSVWGPTWTYIEKESRWSWANPGGDFINRDGTPQTLTNPHITFAANSVTSGSFSYTADATAGVAAAYNGDRYLAFIATRSGGNRDLVTPHHATLPAPRIDVIYTDQSVASLACLSCVRINSSTTQSWLGQPTSTLDRAVIEFARPTKTVLSATLTITVAAHTATASTISFYLANPRANTEGATAGISAEYVGDEGISAHPNVLFAQSYPDGTTLADRMLTTLTTNVFLKSYWTPHFWGLGPPDPTKLPTAYDGIAVAGTNKWLRKNNSSANVTIVGSTYAEEGFVPTAPGRGAMRVIIPKGAQVDGADVGYGLGGGCDLWALFPEPISGIVSDVYVRFRMRLGSSPKTLNDTLMYRSDAASTAEYATAGGKFGLGVHHWTAYGGNNNVGGENLGWSNRLGFMEAPLDIQPAGFVPYIHAWDNIGANIPFGNDGLGGAFYPNRWYDVEIRLKLNTWNSDGTPSPSDAISEVWIDGRYTGQKTNFKYRDLALLPSRDTSASFAPYREMGCIGLLLNHYNGGVLECDHDTIIFYDGVVAATSRIGPLQLPETTAWSTFPEATPGTNASSSNAYLWTPARDANGFITKASVDLLPANTWARVAGTPFKAIADIVTATSGYPFSRFDTTGSGVPGTFDPWVGMCHDGERYMWNPRGGGHGDSGVNGVWSLDLLKMQWGVEKMPSDPLDPTYPQSAYYRITDNNLTSYSTGATDPNVDPDGLLWDMLPDGTPTSTHTYNGVWYDSTRRQLGTSRISKWTYDLATKTWSRQRWTRNGGSPTTFSIYANLFYHAGNDALYGFFDGEYSAYRFGKVAFPGSDEVSISSPGWIGVTVTACRLDEDRALFFFYNGTTTKVEYAAIFNMATETWYKWGGSAWVPNAGATIAVPVTNGVPFDTTFQGAGQMALFIPSWGAQGQVLRTQESATPTEWWIYDIATHTNFSYTPNGAILDQVRVYLPFSKWVSFPTLGLAVGIQTYPRSSSTNNAVYVMRYE